ncbi:hypothetical protein AAHC03_024322 [Spirometra sp. Aus1]
MGGGYMLPRPKKVGNILAAIYPNRSVDHIITESEEAGVCLVLNHVINQKAVFFGKPTEFSGLTPPLREENFVVGLPQCHTGFQCPPYLAGVPPCVLVIALRLEDDDVPEACNVTVKTPSAGSDSSNALSPPRP